jgi:hypothetical protein
MKLRSTLIGLFFILLFSLPIISIAVWYFSPTHSINLLVLDKTVLTTDANEHRSFNWILKHYKFVQPSPQNKTTFYDIGNYKGFFPLDSHKYYVDDLTLYTDQQLDSLADTLDMVYFTDTYGIYHNEWYRDVIQNDKMMLEHSSRIYGGTEMEDYELLKRMHERQKLILLEFNTIASPTRYRIRKLIEDEFGILWSGWIGRYFFSLDTNVNQELPGWVVRLHKEQYNGTWPYKKPGIVFVHESDRIVVLENERDLLHEVPVIQTKLYYQDFYDLPEYMRYPFWFDITQYKDTDLIVSTFKIHVNERGDSILHHHKIPKTFPAVFGDHIVNRFYYFAGDFADNPIPFTAVYTRGIEYLDFFFYDNKDMADRKKFFWRFYRPMMKRILYDYNSIIHNETIEGK